MNRAEIGCDARTDPDSVDDEAAVTVLDRMVATIDLELSVERTLQW